MASAMLWRCAGNCDIEINASYTLSRRIEWKFLQIGKKNEKQRDSLPDEILARSSGQISLARATRR